jgi:hypothetical protein
MTSRIEAWLNALRAAIEGTGLFQDVRVHLDPYDIEEVLKESFKPPAARVVFGLGQPEPEASGGLGLRMVAAIVIITGREGRPDPALASADARALELSQVVAQHVADAPYLGQARSAAVQVTGLKVALSEKTSKQGLAITVIEIEGRLHEWVSVRDPVAEMFSGARPATDPALVINGEPEPQEPT